MIKLVDKELAPPFFLYILCEAGTCSQGKQCLSYHSSREHTVCVYRVSVSYNIEHLRVLFLFYSLYNKTLSYI